MTTNLKHGIKCTKRDDVYQTRYFVFTSKHEILGSFATKLAAINYINKCLSEGSKPSDFILVRDQFIKF